MKNIAVLGSTGSIGQNALRVIKNFPGEFRVVALSTNSNVDVLYRQIKEFNVPFCCVSDRDAAEKLNRRLNSQTRLFVGEMGLEALVENKQIGKILLAISGSAALAPLLKAIDFGKQIALANKEALVMAGPIIMKKAGEKKVKIIPVDSEQSAIWQCLDTGGRHSLKRIYLTASGGPFRQASRKSLKDVSINKVLNHPRWKMGRKISVDSATLMNKGLELLEAMFLFDVPCEKIKILIHPEAMVHSMVEFIDGVVLAQLSIVDMRIPIQYALSYPQRLYNRLSSLDFYKLKALHFHPPDLRRFPCLRLAYSAARELGTMPAVLNAANEVSVEEFLKRRLKFMRIPWVIERVLNRHQNRRNPNLDDILEADQWARAQAYEVMNKLGEDR